MAAGPDDPLDPVMPARPTLRPEVVTILATEHWSLLGTRSMTWAEIMSRITIHLTVVSASLVALALVAQATGFGPVFDVLSIGIASAALLFGTLTELRVLLASEEDGQLIRAMNRLRHAYVDLAPELQPYLTASTHDDFAGLMQTYTLGLPRSRAVHIVGSTAFFVMTVNAVLAGVLGALIAAVAQDSTAVTVAGGVFAALLYFAVLLEVGHRRLSAPTANTRFPSDRD